MSFAERYEASDVGKRELAKLAWMAFALTPGMGPTRTWKAMGRLGAAERLFEASLTELEGLGLPAKSAQFCFEGKARAAAEDEMKRVAEAGGNILTPEDAAYPDRLREIYDPPAVLWIRGNAELLARPGIAVVGTRQPSPYGAGMAELLSRDLANRRLVILSGMARGVDTAAHKGAIDAGGKTVAVWGTGIDVIYPKENKKLAESIVATGGTIVSEYPLGTFPAPQNFPIRNRILSGMSVGVLVIEAAEYSGTRITARCAMEQNRDVFAVPGNGTNKNAWGPNTLIKQGAKLTATWEDVWEHLTPEVKLALTPPPSPESEGDSTASLFPNEGLPPHEKRILSLLKADESTHIDEIVERLEQQLSSSEIFAALFELELSGKIRQMPGKNFVKSM